MNSTETSLQAAVAVRRVSPPVDMMNQRLRILRCTARDLAQGLGGLRFKAGTQPWLEGLQRLGADVAVTRCAAHQAPQVLQVAGD